MKTLVTGALGATREELNMLAALGMDITLHKDERETVACPEQYEAVICNGLFQWNDIAAFSNLKYMQNAVWTYKNTMGLFRQGRYLLILTAAINLVMSIWLGKLWGLFGILFATAIARAFTNTWYDPYAIHKYGFERSVLPYFGRYLTFAALAVAIGAVCWYLCALLPFDLFTNVVLEIFLCSVIFNLSFLLCFSHSAEFKKLLGFAERALRKVKGRF